MRLNLQEKEWTAVNFYETEESKDNLMASLAMILLRNLGVKSDEESHCDLNMSSKGLMSTSYYN